MKILTFALVVTLANSAWSAAALTYPIVATVQIKCYDNRGKITPPKKGEPFYGQDAQSQLHPDSYTACARRLAPPRRPSGTR